VKNLQRRLFDAYAAEVARVDTNHDGIISAPKAIRIQRRWFPQQLSVVSTVSSFTALL